MSQNVRRGIKDGSDYQWMRSQPQHHSGQYHHQQPQATHHQQFPYSSNSHQLYPTTGGMGHHPYYAPPAHPSPMYPYNDQSGHHHHQGSWSNGSAAVPAVDHHHHPHGMTFPSHPLAYTSPHHDPSAHQYMDMFSSPPVQSPYGYNNSYHHHHHEQPVSDPFWTPNTKEDEGQQQPQDYYDPSEQDGMNSLEMGMNSLTVDTTFSDRELFSRDLEMFKKNQAYASSQRKEQSSWASVAAGTKNKTALLKAKMLASRPTTDASIPNSIETSPNSSTWGESSKNGYSPKTPPTPSSSIGSSSAPHSTSSVPPASSSAIPSNQESRPLNHASSQRNAFPGPSSSHHPPSSSSSFNRSAAQTSHVSNGRQPPHDQRNQGSWRQHSLQDRDNNYAPREDRTRQPSLKEDKQNDRNPSDDRKVERILERPTAAPSSRPRPVVARSSTSESDQHNTTSSSCLQSVPNPSASKAPLKPVIDPSLVMDKQQLEHIYNPKTFDLDPVDARFFVIKSYSEDDIHRSIKYSIWCSTEHGNKRLDTAFKSQEGRGPVYLFYSVNGSGHFCGMAQMMSPLDYHSSANVWAQDKWKGQFKVKWIYVKDVPNSQLRHIRLENNENKPVTNSRDTQEVFAEQGKQVLSIIHSYRHTTSIFDDYLHYEKRQEEVSSQRKSESDAPEVTQPRDVPRDKPGFGRGNRDDFRRNHPNDKAFSSRDHPSSEFDERRGGSGRQPFFSNNNNNFHSSQQQSSYGSNYSRDRDHNHHNRHRPSNFNSRRDQHDTHSSWRQ